MVTFKIAFRSLLRRKSRMLLIGVLVVFGTLLASIALLRRKK